MHNAGEIRISQRRKQQHWFGIWGVRNYYHKLELQAEAGAEYNLGYFLLISQQDYLRQVAHWQIMPR